LTKFHKHLLSRLDMLAAIRDAKKICLFVYTSSGYMRVKAMLKRTAIDAALSETKLDNRFRFEGDILTLWPRES